MKGHHILSLLIFLIVVIFIINYFDRFGEIDEFFYYLFLVVAGGSVLWSVIRFLIKLYKGNSNDDSRSIR